MWNQRIKVKEQEGGKGKGNEKKNFSENELKKISWKIKENFPSIYILFCFATKWLKKFNLWVKIVIFKKKKKMNGGLWVVVILGVVYFVQFSTK